MGTFASCKWTKKNVGQHQLVVKTCQGCFPSYKKSSYGHLISIDTEKQFCSAALRFASHVEYLTWSEAEL